jgi:hypothetical protein
MFLFLLLLRGQRAGLAQWHSAGLRDGRSGVRFPAGAGNFYLHHRCVQTGSGAHSVTYSLGTRVPFPGVKRPEREADHLPSSAEVKNARSYTSTPPIRLHGGIFS